MMRQMHQYNPNNLSHTDTFFILFWFMCLNYSDYSERMLSRSHVYVFFKVQKENSLTDSSMFYDSQNTTRPGFIEISPIN